MDLAMPRDRSYTYSCTCDIEPTCCVCEKVCRRKRLQMMSQKRVVNESNA